MKCWKNILGILGIENTEKSTVCKLAQHVCLMLLYPWGRAAAAEHLMRQSDYKIVGLSLPHEKFQIYWILPIFIQFSNSIVMIIH